MSCTFTGTKPGRPDSGSVWSRLRFGLWRGSVLPKAQGVLLSLSACPSLAELLPRVRHLKRSDESGQNAFGQQCCQRLSSDNTSPLRPIELELLLMPPKEQRTSREHPEIGLIEDSSGIYRGLVGNSLGIRSPLSPATGEMPYRTAQTRTHGQEIRIVKNDFWEHLGQAVISLVPQSN